MFFLSFITLFLLLFNVGCLNLTDSCRNDSLSHCASIQRKDDLRRVGPDSNQFAPNGQEMNPPLGVSTREYQMFLESLYMMRDARIHNLQQLNLLTKSTRPNSSEFHFRKFNFSTGEHFEAEFDCDWSMLANCESSLLEKIERIEGRHVVFTLNRFEEDEVASQLDILHLCRSMDIEFNCLLNYAEKCESKMTWATFSILKYIITDNNETIISCRNKEKDWLGGQDNDVELEEWVDINGVIHYRNYHSGSCIQTQEVYDCVVKNFGYQFDLGRDVIHNQQQCEAAVRYEHCIKQLIFEKFMFNQQENTSPPCSLDEKETTLHILLRSLKIDPSIKDISPVCKIVAHWKHVIPKFGSETFKFLDDLDPAGRMSSSLKHDHEAILTSHCLNDQLVNAHQPCWTRFENRLKTLWHNDNLGRKLPEEVETTQFCCAQSEVNLCMSVYVLLRCGKEQFLQFGTKLIKCQLDQCYPYDYSSHSCQTYLN